MANTTWPFATLKANKDKLELNATIIGNLVFKPGDIISIAGRSGKESGVGPPEITDMKRIFVNSAL